MGLLQASATDTSIIRDAKREVCDMLAKLGGESEDGGVGNIPVQREFSLSDVEPACLERIEETDEMGISEAGFYTDREAAQGCAGLDGAPVEVCEAVGGGCV